jgi:hypothetical protein
VERLLLGLNGPQHGRRWNTRFMSGVDPRIQRETGLIRPLRFEMKMTPSDNEGLLSEPWRHGSLEFLCTGCIKCKSIGENCRPKWNFTIWAEDTDKPRVPLIKTDLFDMNDWWRDRQTPRPEPIWSVQHRRNLPTSRAGQMGAKHSSWEATGDCHLFDAEVVTQATMRARLRTKEPVLRIGLRGRGYWNLFIKRRPPYTGGTAHLPQDGIPITDLYDVVSEWLVPPR